MRAPGRGIRRLAGTLKRGGADRRGLAAVELALVSPMLLALLLGTSEIAHFLKVHYQAAQMSSTVADAIARYDMLTSDDVAAVLSASTSVMGAQDFATKGYVILTSVRRAGATDAPVIAWQCRGGGSDIRPSRVGSASTAVTLPGSLVLDGDDNVIIAEVFYGYSNLFDFIPLADKTVYKNAVFRPRLGALTTVSGC